MDTFTIVSSSSGDWEGLYKNNTLLIEDHTLNVQHVLKVLGIKVIEKCAEEEWLENRGRLPNHLSDVKF
jgi:hypothetical protein